MTNKRPVVATRLQHPFGARWVQVFALSLLATACTPRAPGARRLAIIGGDLAPLETGVVELVSYPPSQSTLFLCTATLVHPRQLMTAAHCVDAPNHLDHTFGVFVGTDATNVDLDALLPVAAVDYPSTYDPSDSTADVAVITLVDPLALPIHAPILDPLEASVVTGRAARLVGYGRSDYNDVSSAGLRRAVTTTVATLEPKFLVIGDATKHTCIGDSGGPAFDVGPGATSPPRLLAVNSNGPFGCTGASSFTRLDLHATWLQDHLLVDPAPDLGTDAATSAPDLLAGDLRAADLRGADLRAGADGATIPDLADAADDASPGEDLASGPRRKAGACAAGGGAPDAGLLWILLVLAARTCRWRLTP